MAEESLNEGEDENILYDLLVITEWPPETDTQVSQTSIYACFQFSVWVFCWAFICKRKKRNATGGKSTLISYMGSTAQSHVAETYRYIAS